MCDFHSIVVRRDGVIAHEPGNSHSKAVELFKWTENDSVHKQKRFVECEWNGIGDFVLENVVKNDDISTLTQHQVSSITSHYTSLMNALKGKEVALDYFSEPQYSDVLNKVWELNDATPELIARLFCNKTKIDKQVNDLILKVKKLDSSKTASSGDYSKAASSGYYSTAASSGDYSKAASSGNSSTAASSGDYSKAVSSGNSSKTASSGDYSKAASSGYSSKAVSSGYYSKTASSGDSSKAASSGDSSTAVSSGNSSKAASSGDYSTAASSGDYSKAASSGDSSTAASSGDYSTAASSGDYSKAESSGNSSKAASSGYYSTAAAVGKDTIAVVAGLYGKTKVGENGCLSLVWDDGNRNRIVVGYAGEDGIKANTWYTLNNKGELIEVK